MSHRPRQRLVVVDPLPGSPEGSKPPSEPGEVSADTSSLSSTELAMACKVLEAAGKMAYTSLAAYCHLRGVKITPGVLTSKGEHAARLCRKRRLPIKKLPDERVQFVNAYPVVILDEVFSTH